MQLDLDKLQPLHDYVVFRRDATGGKTPGGILIPSTQYHDSFFATVLAVGPGRWVNGKRVEPEVKVNDRIIVSQHDRDVIDPTGDQQVQYCKEGSILAILPQVSE